MSESRDRTRSLVSWENATLAWGSHAQWNGSEEAQFINSPYNIKQQLTSQPFPVTTPVIWPCSPLLVSYLTYCKLAMHQMYRHPTSGKQDAFATYTHTCFTNTLQCSHSAYNLTCGSRDDFIQCQTFTSYFDEPYTDPSD